MRMIRALFLISLLGCNLSYAGLFGEDEQVVALRNQISEMEARIVKMEQVLNNQGLLDLYSKVETLGAEVNRLNGQIETLNNENSLLQKRQKDFYIDLDNRLRTFEESGAKPGLPYSPSKNSPRSMIDPSPEESAADVAASNEAENANITPQESAPSSSSDAEKKKKNKGK